MTQVDSKSSRLSKGKRHSSSLLLKVYGLVISVSKSIIKTSADYFGLETKLRSDSGIHGDLDTNNNTIYSILNDCRDLSIVKKGRASELNLNPEEEIALDDLSNLAFNRSAVKKREPSFCLTTDSKGCTHELVGQDRTAKAIKRPPSKSGETSKQSTYFEPSPLTRFQGSQASHSISRIKSKSPRKRDTRTNFDEEFSRLFNGESQNPNGDCSFTYHKNSSKTVKQSNRTLPIEREMKDEPFYREVRDSGLELVKTSCFGGHLPVVALQSQQRNVSKERATSSSRLKSARGNAAQAGVHNKENVHRPQQQSPINKPRPQKRDMSHTKLQSTTLIQDISREEIETPSNGEEIEMYIPKGLRKKKKDSTVLSKVDHRREKSPIKNSQPVAILDKQFKSAKITTFESVMQSLKGSQQR